MRHKFTLEIFLEYYLTNMLSDYFEFEFQKDDWIYSMPPLMANFEKNVQEKHDSVMV